VCTKLDQGGFGCSCISGILAPDNRSCVASGFRQSNASTINAVIHCAVDNGLCDQTCVPASSQPGQIPVDHCTCSAGFTLDRNGYKCVDIDECSPNATLVCPQGYLCLNAFGSYVCIRIFGNDVPIMLGQRGTSDVEASQVAEELDSISEKLKPGAVSAGRLSIIFYSMISWVTVMTLLLIAVGVILYRRRRPTGTNCDDPSSISSDQLTFSKDASSLDSVSITHT
jgi:hypothetical protein